VQKVLDKKGIVVPDEGLDEIEGRNIVAHTLSLPGGEPYDLEEGVRRVRIARTLLAAVVLREVGYEGALAGWDLDDRGWPITAAWFPPTKSATEAAQQRYEANAQPEFPTADGE
jgi:hypothetical protein